MIERGQIYFVSLDPTRGRERSGHRPVLVLSADAINRQPLVVTVAVGTSGKNVERDYPTNVRLSPRETGLPEETVLLCFQIRSIDPARLADSRTGQPIPVGRVSEDRMPDINRCTEAQPGALAPIRRGSFGLKSRSARFQV